MSSCIKDSYDYNWVKKHFKCGNISLKNNFHRDIKKNDGFIPYCKLCRKVYRKKYSNEHYDLEINRRRKYRFEIKIKLKNSVVIIGKEQMNTSKTKKQSDLKINIACNLRSRTSIAFKSQNVRKTNKTIDLLGCSHYFFKRWILYQLYRSNMTIENYGSVWQIDHCLPIASFNLLDETDMKKSFDCVNLRPMYSNENNSKKAKIDHYLYLCQEVKAKYFLKLNAQEG